MNNPKSVFHKYGINIVRYADDFVLMGNGITEQAMLKLKKLLDRMGLTLNEDKTCLLQAKQDAFNFLGFSVRYDKDLYGDNSGYWNICPSRKSEQKIRDKVRKYLKTHGHCGASVVTSDLNAILRGWLNYFDIKGVSYLAVSKRRLRYYLLNSLYRYYNRKSQRKCRLYGQNAFEALVQKYGLIDPTKYSFQRAQL